MKFTMPVLLAVSTLVCANLANANESSRYACGRGAQKVFSLYPSAKCLRVALEEGWENFLFYPNAIVDVQPSTLVQDGAVRKLWVRLYNTRRAVYIAPGVRRFEYDGMKAVYGFTCGKREQLLVQATYTLNGRTKYERLSSEAIPEEIEPDTVSEALYTKYCSK